MEEAFTSYIFIELKHSQMMDRIQHMLCLLAVYGSYRMSQLMAEIRRLPPSCFDLINWLNKFMCVISLTLLGTVIPNLRTNISNILLSQVQVKRVTQL